MTNVTIFGGSGYAGKHIAGAAAVNGHAVRSFSRSEPAEQISGARYETGSITDADARARALADTDVVVVAISPRGDMLHKVRPAIAQLAEEARSAGVRVGVIGGAGSLLTSDGGPRLVDTPEFHEAFKSEALEMSEVLEDLRAAHEGLDWFYVSPAGTFGAFAPGEYRGEYRVGGDVLLTDAEGNSEISGADFGVAIVDEIETSAHRRTRFTVAY